MDLESTPEKAEKKVMITFPEYKSLALGFLNSHLHLRVSAFPCALRLFSVF